jgi:hypothetical protein
VGAGAGRDAVRPLVIQAAALLGLGVMVGLLWATLTPTVSGWSDGVEKDISGEVAFAGLGVLAGLLVAVAGLVRPGRHPVAGAVVRLLGSVVAALLAWGVGRAAGAPELAATGVLVLWPLATALATALVLLVQVLIHPDASPPS